MAQPLVAYLQPCTWNAFSFPGSWSLKGSWPPGAWGLLTRKVAVFLWVVVFRPLEQGIEGVLGSGSHLGEGLLEGVEKGRRGGRREGKHTDSKC